VSDEACRAAERADHMAQSLDAKLSCLATGTETDRDEGISEDARIEGICEPMTLALEGGVHACVNHTMSIAVKIGVSGEARLVEVAMR
jgi:hypothetical protein